MKRRLRVKICGITRPEDAALVSALGADALGMVFWPGSPRAVDEAAAREIVAAAGPLVTRVGVFVDADPEEMLGLARSVGLDLLQLHGNEPPELCQSLGRRTIKAFRVGPGFTAAEVLRYPVDGYLLDTRVAGMPGGTGQTFDWALARDIPRDKLILAGGIGVDNLADAVRALSPGGVDVSSSVETQPGRKDPDRLKRFFDCVRSLS